MRSSAPAIFTVLLTATWYVPAWCQSASSPEETGPKLEEVLVTAQKRTENLQDVPIAVTALSADRLDAAGISSTADVGLVTPGLTVTNIAGFALPHIRGVGTTAYGAG